MWPCRPSNKKKKGVLFHATQTARHHLAYVMDDEGEKGVARGPAGAASVSTRPCDVVHIRSKKHYDP